MLIDHFSRGYMKYVSRVLGIAAILSMLGVFLRPDTAGPTKYMFGFVMVLYLSIAGFICLARPSIIQEHLVQQYSRYPKLARASPFSGFVKTAGYIVFLRICGGTAWLIVGILAYAFRTRL